MPRGVAAKGQAASGLFEQSLQVPSSGSVWRRVISVAPSVQHHIASGQIFVRRQVTHPVVGQVRADHRHMARPEWADIVAGQ